MATMETVWKESATKQKVHTGVIRRCFIKYTRTTQKNGTFIKDKESEIATEAGAIIQI